MTELKYMYSMMQVRIDRSGECAYCDEIQILLVLDGKMTMNLNGKRMELLSDDLVFLNIGDRYSFSCSKNIFFVSVTYPGEQLAECAEEQLVLVSDPMSQEPERCNEIKSMLQSMLTNYWKLEQKMERASILLTEIKAQYYQLLEFLMQHYRCSDLSGRANSQNEDVRMHQISLYVHHNYAKAVSLKELAGQLYLSEGYLSRYVRQKFGMKFSDYVKKIRLSHAREDLQHTENSITQIIYESGFSSPGFFYREFKKKYGMSPMEYREQRVSAAGTEDNRQEKAARLEQYIRPSVREQNRSDHTSRSIYVFVEQLQKNSRQTQTMINIGRAADLLDREMQEHLRILQRKCQFDYVRIWDIFSRDLMIDIAHVQGAYNFRKLDQVLDLILELHMIPFLDLDKKEQRVNADVNDTMIYEKGTVMFDSLGAWQRLWSSVLTHWLERYGRECLEKWKVEVWHGGYQISGCSVQESFFQIFAETGRLMKEKIPGMQLGGPGIFPGCMSDQTENHFFRQWAAQDMIQPDFISMMEYDYVVNEPENRPADGTGMERMEEQNGFRQKSTNPSVLSDRIKRLRDWMQQSGFEQAEICISEWNKTVSDRCSLSDSCYQGAYVLKNLCDIRGMVDVIGYQSGTDMMSEFYDSNAFLFGGKGILTRDKIMKPAGVAFQFMKELYETADLGNEHGMITTDGKGNWAIACHNMRPLSQFYYYSAENQINKETVRKCFADQNRKQLQICLEGVQDATCQIRILRVNDKSGSIMQLWEQLDFAKNLSNEDMEYLQRCCQPKVERFHQNTEKNGLQFTLELEPNEIALIQIRSMLTHRQAL